METLKKPLPLTFRINNASPFRECIIQRIQNEFTFENLKIENEIVPTIQYVDNR